MDASQITFPVGEKFYFLLFKRSRVSCDNSPSRPGSLTAQSKQALLLNSQFSGEKEATISNKAGKRSITAESLSAAQPPATTGLLEPGLKCQAWTMRCDKLLSSNSCTANFQLYTQMALRLGENGVHGENSSRFLCLFGSECGGGRMTSRKERGSEESEFELGKMSHPQSWGDLWFPRLALGSPRREMTLPPFVGLFLVWWFVSFDPSLTLCWKFATDLAAASIGPSGIRKAPFPGSLAIGAPDPHRPFPLLSYFLRSPPASLDGTPFLVSLLFTPRARLPCFIPDSEETLLHSQ